MSYGLSLIGKKGDVVAAMQNNQYIPKAVKDFIVASVTAIPDPAPNVSSYDSGDCVLVEANGHEPGQHNIKIKKYTSAPPAPTPPAPTVAATAAAAPPAPDSASSS